MSSSILKSSERAHCNRSSIRAGLELARTTPIARPSIVTPEWYQSNVVTRKYELRKSIRIISGALQAFRHTGIDTLNRHPGFGLPMFSPGPVARWNKANGADELRAERRRLQGELDAIEERYPTNPFWKPRPATAQDRRIAKQYRVASTFKNNRLMTVRDAEFYAARHKHKHRRQDA